MKTELIYFSATGTTRNIATAFARGMNCTVQYIDITGCKRRETVTPVTGDLTIIALPVYGERIPKFLYEYLDRLDGAHKPLVAISVFGNIGYGISLEQFAQYAPQHRFTLIGAGAFVGEHTYAGNIAPAACARPDETDLEQALRFGSLVREKYERSDWTPVALPNPRGARNSVLNCSGTYSGPSAKNAARPKFFSKTAYPGMPVPGGTADSGFFAG